MNSLLPITPSNFLSINARHSSLPRPEPLPFVPKDGSSRVLLQSWLKGIQHLDRFWRRWRDEYLLSLREQHRWEVKQNHPLKDKHPQVGDVVMLREELPRGTWKLAKIQQLHNSTDNQIRAATVQLPSGRRLIRSLADLAPLELDENE